MSDACILYVYTENLVVILDLKPGHLNTTTLKFRFDFA